MILDYRSGPNGITKFLETGRGESERQQHVTWPPRLWGPSQVTQAPLEAGKGQEVGAPLELRKESSPGTYVQLLASGTLQRRDWYCLNHQLVVVCFCSHGKLTQMGSRETNAQAAGTRRQDVLRAAMSNAHCLGISPIKMQAQGEGVVMLELHPHAQGDRERRGRDPPNAASGAGVHAGASGLVSMWGARSAGPTEGTEALRSPTCPAAGTSSTWMLLSQLASPAVGR